VNEGALAHWGAVGPEERKVNNQPEPLIIQILFCHKNLHVSGIFSAHHQEFSTVHSALVSFMQVFDDRFQADSRWNCSSILNLLGSGHQNLDETYQCRIFVCLFVYLFSCRYNPLWLYFHRPVAGFSLLVFEVS
jgi:hypothetical protein